MNISRRDQGLLVFLVIVLLGFAFFRFIYSPAGAEINTVTADNQELQLEKERLTEIIDAPPKPAEDEDKFADLDKSLPTEDEMIPLLTMLDETIAECELPFASLDYKGAEPNPAGVQTLVFTVGVKGSVYQLLNLLTMLENTDRLISVEDVSFTGVKLEAPAASSGESEGRAPVYYIQPPDIPEAKLQRIKLEVVQEEEPPAQTQTEKPVASTFLADNYDMKFTIKAYYADEILPAPSEDDQAEQADGTEGTEGTEGEV